MFKNPYVAGFVLFVITMALFFITYLFFGGANFFTNSLVVNAFLLPVAYCIFAFLSVYFVWKSRKMNFKEIFRNAFLPMFIGGFLSVITIFLYLNFINPSAKQLLNRQFVERNKAELTSVYTKEKSRLKTQAEIDDLNKDYNKSMQSFDEKRTQQKDIFSVRFFMIYFAAICIFYMIISAFFGAFLRSREV